MATTADYFKIFKIKSAADIDERELKRRFRILVKKYHPDRPPHGNARKFNLIKNAYEYVLKLIQEHSQKQNQKFTNPNFVFYGNGSIFDKEKNRWVRIKGVRINIKV